MWTGNVLALIEDLTDGVLITQHLRNVAMQFDNTFVFIKNAFPYRSVGIDYKPEIAITLNRIINVKSINTGPWDGQQFALAEVE